MPASILKEPREQRENILFTFKDEHLTEVLGLTKGDYHADNYL